MKPVIQASFVTLDFFSKLRPVSRLLVLRRHNIRKVHDPETHLPMSEQDLSQEPDVATPVTLPGDTTALIPETRKKKIGIGELILLTFFWTTGGPFGIER